MIGGKVQDPFGAGQPALPIAEFLGEHFVDDLLPLPLRVVAVPER
jgi:hypothetical protein